MKGSLPGRSAGRHGFLLLHKAKLILAYLASSLIYLFSHLAGKSGGVWAVYLTAPHFAIDLMARSPDQIRERLTLGDVFLREITEKGKVIYEAHHAGMDSNIASR